MLKMSLNLGPVYFNGVDGRILDNDDARVLSQGILTAFERMSNDVLDGIEVVKAMPSTNPSLKEDAVNVEVIIFDPLLPRDVSERSANAALISDFDDETVARVVYDLTKSLFRKKALRSSEHNKTSQEQLA